MRNKILFLILPFIGISPVFGQDKPMADQLMNAASKGDEKSVSKLLKLGASVKSEDKQGNTPLIEAANTGGNPKVVQILIKNGADVNVRGAYGITPLIAASTTCNLEIIKLLLQAGANPDIAMKNGQTALIGAVSVSQVKEAAPISEKAVVTLLASSKKSVNARNENGISALQVARMTGNKTIQELLIKAGAKD